MVLSTPYIQGKVSFVENFVARFFFCYMIKTSISSDHRELHQLSRSDVEQVLGDEHFKSLEENQHDMNQNLQNHSPDQQFCELQGTTNVSNLFFEHTYSPLQHLQNAVMSDRGYISGGSSLSPSPLAAISPLTQSPTHPTHSVSIDPAPTFSIHESNFNTSRTSYILPFAIASGTTNQCDQLPHSQSGRERLKGKLDKMLKAKAWALINSKRSEELLSIDYNGNT